MYLDTFYATLVDLCYASINGDPQAVNTIRLIQDHLEGLDVLTGAVYPKVIDFVQTISEVARHHSLIPKKEV